MRTDWRWQWGNDMNKLKDLMMDQQEELGVMLQYADSCILIEKIIDAYPDLEKSRAMELCLLEHLSVKMATHRARMTLFRELAEILEPSSGDSCIEAYHNLKLTNPNLIIAKEAVFEEYERQEYEDSYAP